MFLRRIPSVLGPGSRLGRRSCILSPAAALLFLSGFVSGSGFSPFPVSSIFSAGSAFAAFSASPLAASSFASSSSIRSTSWLFFNVEIFLSPRAFAMSFNAAADNDSYFSLIIKRCSLSFCVLHHSVMNLFYLSYFNFYSDFWFDFLILGILPAKFIFSAAISL